MPPKQPTDAELQELERLRREKRQREEDERRQRETGWFDRITGMFSGFGFFEMIAAFFVIGGLYLAAKANPEITQNLIEKLPDSWQATISGVLNRIGIDVDMRKTLTDMPVDTFHKFAGTTVSPEILAVVAPTTEAKNGFIAFVAEANGGKVTANDFTNEKTIFALMTKRPEMARQLAAAAMKSGADNKGSDTANTIKASLKAIVGDEKRLTELLGEKHRANTIHLLTTLASSQGVSMQPSAIEALLDRGTNAEGKPTENLRKALILAIDGDIKAAAATLIQPANSNPDSGKPLTTTTLLAVVGRDNLKTDMQKAFYDAAKANPALLDDLLNALGTENANAALVTLAQANDPAKAMRQLALKPEALHALPQAIAFASSVPALTSQLPFKLEALSTLMQTTGLEKDGKPNAALQNLLVTISDMPALKLEALIKPLKTYILSPEVANNPQSAGAIKNFLGGVDTKALSVGDKQLVAAIQQELTPERLALFSAINQNKVDGMALMGAFMDTKADGSRAFNANRLVGVLMKKEAREALRFAGTEHIAGLVAPSVPLLSKHNLDRLLAFGDAIGSNPENQKNAERTMKVMLIATRAYEHGSLKEALAGITAKDISGFFKIPGNHDAFLNLLKDFDVSALPAKQQALVKGLYGLMGNHKDGGLTKTLADENDVAFLLTQVREGSKLEVPEWVKNAALRARTHNPETISKLGTLIQETIPDTAPQPTVKPNGFAHSGFSVVR